MSKYLVFRSESGELLIHCNQKAIPMKAMLDLAEPLFDFGNNSEGSMNLAYCIICDCLDEVWAESMHMEFISQFLLHQKSLPFESDGDAVKEHLSLCAKADVEARKVNESSTTKE